MAGNAWPSDNKAFKPDGGKELQVKGVPEPRLGKVFQFDPIVQRHPRPLPQVPIPESAYPPELSGDGFDDPLPMAAPPAPPVKPPVVATAAAAPEGPEGRVKISAERLAFLERVEALVAAESRINDLETVNRSLISIVSRLQRQLEETQKGAQKA
jgi:hypothetical protein